MLHLWKGFLHRKCKKNLPEVQKSFLAVDLVILYWFLREEFLGGDKGEGSTDLRHCFPPASALSKLRCPSPSLVLVLAVVAPAVAVDLMADVAVVGRAVSLPQA